jgi:hypothetical protein
MPPGDRIALLRSIAAMADPVDRLTANQLIVHGLTDRRVEVRRAALNTYIASMKLSPRVDEARGSDGLAVEARIRSLILKALDDPAELVRRSAIVAALALDAELLRGGRRQAKPSLDVISAIARCFQREPTSRLRMLIVASLGIIPFTASDWTSARQADALILAGLEDAAETVVWAAVRSAERRHLTSALPRIASLLSHPPERLRRVAAQSLGTFGAAAAPYRLKLQVALDIERHPLARSAMEYALTAISGR